VLREGPPATLVRLWRAAFHARAHLALEEAAALLPDAALRARIDRIGQTEFDEIRRVLRADDLLLPPHDDRQVYAEFGALLLELDRFAPSLMARTFPTLREPAQALAVIREDVDATALLASCRPEGAPEPRRDTKARESTTPTYSALPALDMVPFLSGRARTADDARKLVSAADRARAEKNHVRSALLRLSALPAFGEEQEVKLRAAVRADLDALGARLDAALAPPQGTDTEPPAQTPWTSSLLMVAAKASERQALRYPVEARLLYDLQRACVDHERQASAVDLVTWALSLGKRPIVRPLPATRTLRVVRHLHRAQNKLRNVELPPAERKLFARLLRFAVRRAEDNVRATLRPALMDALDAVGLRPENLPERVARAKLVEELCDQAVTRQFLGIGQLRDALSRNQLKLRDLAVPGELWSGDPLLRADRLLAERLDGVYRRGEVYLRALQNLSGMTFGTRPGRFLALYLILPLGGAYVLLEGVAHMVALVAKLLGAEEPHLPSWFDPPHPLNWILLLSTSVVLFGLIHSEGLRTFARRALSLLGAALSFVFVRVPRWVLSLPPVRRLIESRLVRGAMRYVLVPLALAAGLYMVTPLHDIGPLGLTGIFLVLSVLLNTRLGLLAQEMAIDQVAIGWEAFKRSVVPGLWRLIMGTFRALLELSERTLYRVDEWLRFHEGDRRATIPLKAGLGLVWFFVAYLIRLYVTLLIEPEINPIKHFPVVTVSHKIMVPFYPGMLAALKGALDPLGAVVASTIAGTTVFLFPSVFGFLVWEFKENFRLYRENRPRHLLPVPIGHHGETVGTLMRPGFHSGTLPKLYAKLRRAARRAEIEEGIGETRARSALRTHQEHLDEVKEAVRLAVTREVAGLLGEHRRFSLGRVEVKAVELGSNRLRVELICPRAGSKPLALAFEEQSGLVVASVADPGFLDRVPSGDDRVMLENALAGLYCIAGVDLVREQIRAAIGDVPYDIADEGLLVWPGEGYRTEVVYRLDPGFRGPQVEPLVRGAAPATRPPPLDLRKILFRDQHVPWADWVAAWRDDRPPGEPVPRVLFGTSILPPPRKGHEMEHARPLPVGSA
jgi:hypothetical protein